LNGKPFRFFFFMTAFLFSTAMLMGFGAKEENEAKTEETAPRYFRDRNGPAPPPEGGEAGEKSLETVRVTGRVRLVGSGVYTELVISGDGGEWHTEPEDRSKLINLQQRIVTVEGTLDSQELILPNREQPARWLILRDITVIHSE
jgi:hypothetical protein